MKAGKIFDGAILRVPLLRGGDFSLYSGAKSGNRDLTLSEEIRKTWYSSAGPFSQYS